MTSKCVTLPGYGGTDQAGAMLSEEIGDLIAPVNKKATMFSQPSMKNTAAVAHRWKMLR